MKHLQWKLTFSFFCIAMILLFFCQVLFLVVKPGNPGEILSTVIRISPSLLLFYLVQAFSAALLLSIPVALYLYSCSLRIHQLINASRYWGRGDFSITVHGNEKGSIGYLVRHLNTMAQELQKMREMQQEMASVKERNLLARELHDTVKQQIFALAFQISIARKLHQSKNDQLALHLQEAKKILSDIQEELVNLIVPMRQGTLENQDLADALATYLSRWSHQYGIFVKFTTEIQGQEKNYFLSAYVKGTFFRVAQEALSNVGRHSKASSVHVTLTIGWLYITLKIVDDGQGFRYDERKESGVGLSSMRERMKSIDGDLSIESKVLSGTEIIATYRPKDTGPNVAMLKTTRK